MNDSKSINYRELVKTVKESYRNCDSDSEMEWCDVYDGEDLCREINLWTYWQGFGYAENTPHIKYLVIGQDFGPIKKEEQSVALDNVRKLNSSGRYSLDKGVLMFHTGIDLNIRDAQTDKKLIELFDILGYKEIDKKPYSDLFFTNYCLGYRNNNKLSGPVKSSVINKDREYIKTLIDILEPDNIITLGAIATRGVLKVLKVDYNKKQKFKDLIGETYTYNGSRIFASAHTGYWGVRNRGNDKVTEDWENIRSCAK